MTDSYTDWDAAYVLGALSHDERLTYEDHLDGCARCAAAVAELGLMPALLRLVDEPALEPGETPVASAASVPSIGGRSRRARWALAGAAAALVAALVVAVGVGVPLASHRGPDQRTVELAAVSDAPLRATVTLTPRSWGTEVAMTCDYTAAYGASSAYALYVVDAAGHRQLVSRWRAGPGDTARTSGATDLSVDAITRVELQRADGPVLLADTLHE